MLLFINPRERTAYQTIEWITALANKYHEPLKIFECGTEVTQLMTNYSVHELPTLIAGRRTLVGTRHITAVRILEALGYA
jgi:hypothetical protein